MENCRCKPDPEARASDRRADKKSLTDASRRGQVREMSMAQQIKLEKSYGKWKQTGASDLRNQVAG